LLGQNNKELYELTKKIEENGSRFPGFAIAKGGLRRAEGVRPVIITGETGSGKTVCEESPGQLFRRCEYFRPRCFR
jgi:HrpA-like RNA helicase